MQEITTSWRFWLFWVFAFLGFPIAGLLANLVGAVTTPVRAVLAGAIAGAVLGLFQWLVLKSRLPQLSIWWIIATSAGFAIGLAISTALLGSETAGSELLWRGVITGLCIGAAQCLVLRQVLPLPQSLIWIGVVGLVWALGWFVTRSAGIDLSLKWAVFGASGALIFQLVTGLALYFHAANSPGNEMTRSLLTGLLLIIVPIAFNATFFLLQKAFSYPDILRQPTETILRRFQQGGAPLRRLWYAFTFSAVLFTPVPVLVHQVFEPDAPWFLVVGTVIGVLAGVVQFLGLIRWPFLVPTLAEIYTDPKSTQATRDSAAVTFQAFHRYAGVAIGEHLGYLFHQHLDGSPVYRHHSDGAGQSTVWLAGNTSRAWRTGRRI